jgi:hypothetical protein
MRRLPWKYLRGGWANGITPKGAGVFSTCFARKHRAGASLAPLFAGRRVGWYWPVVLASGRLSRLESREQMMLGSSRSQVKREPSPSGIIVGTTAAYRLTARQRADSRQASQAVVDYDTSVAGLGYGDPTHCFDAQDSALRCPLIGSENAHSDRQTTVRFQRCREKR